MNDPGSEKPDVEAFRLRGFIDSLIEQGEAELVDEPTALADLAARLDGNRRAVLFRNAGPEGAHVVGNVMGSRARLAAAFGVSETELLGELLHRIVSPQRCIEIASSEAPVHQIIREGDDADLTRLPVPFQHGLDGAPYISSAIDYVTDPSSGLTNVGCRRLMLRGRRETGIDLITPSDLKAIYQASAARGEKLPISFTVGAHPLDHVAATLRIPVDETGLVANLRARPLALVKCVSNDIRVPADAEIVLEGYLDEGGYSAHEGPFGEFLGYYGVMKINPVFRLTALTMRRDAVFQTTTIGGRFNAMTDSAPLVALRTEAVVWRALETAVRRPMAVHAVTATGGILNVRVSLDVQNPGEARNAIAATFGCMANIKNVFVVDDDIDIFSSDDMEWALATRFQPDRDLVVESGFRAIPLDPSLEGARIGSKAGFDLTVPFGAKGSLKYTVPAPPNLDGERFDSVAAALEDGPKTFQALMAAINSRDGREVVLTLAELREDGVLDRREDGAYFLK